MKKFLLIIIFLFQYLFVVAQQSNATYEFQAKYHMLDSSELYAPHIAGKSFVATAPPNGTVRAIAEWEPAQAVLVGYPGDFGIPYTLIAAMSENCKVITIVESASQQTTVTANHTANGVNMANCQFIMAPLDS